MRKIIYNKYLGILKQKLINKYDELGLRAHGNYEDELEEIIQEDKMTMLGAFHSWFMEHGRGQNANPDDYKKLAPIIYEWIDVKDGLPAFFKENQSSMSFAIAHKIANEGIDVPNENNKGKVISSVVEDFMKNDMPEMMNELELLEIENLESDIVKELTSEV